MAAEPRSVLFDRKESGIYHCYNRCVRRASLCGEDHLTGKSYSHRKDWIADRLAYLARGFAIDVLDFCAMDNHLHLLLRNRPDLVELWNDREVAERWVHLCPSELEKLQKQQARRLAAGLISATAVADVREQYLKTMMNDQTELITLRDRLSDISWLMKLLCENIARQANREDEVTGKFWESRFQSDRILDEANALACSMYINLNPVRAQIAVAPEECSHTSLGIRMVTVRDMLLSVFGPDALHTTADDQAAMIDLADVQDGELVGEGFHTWARNKHAEVIALEAAGARAKGADLYVTLEPCNHHGRTAPCVDAILASGVKSNRGVCGSQSVGCGSGDGAAPVEWSGS
mgnify:CR=1 FL=1